MQLCMREPLGNLKTVAQGASLQLQHHLHLLGCCSNGPAAARSHPHQLPVTVMGGAVMGVIHEAPPGVGGGRLALLCRSARRACQCTTRPAIPKHFIRFISDWKSHRSARKACQCTTHRAVPEHFIRFRL